MLSNDVLCLGGDLETISGVFSPKKRVQRGMGHCCVCCAFPNERAGSCSGIASAHTGASKCALRLQVLQPAKCILYLKVAKARTVLVSSAVPLQSKSSVCLKRCFGTPVQNLPAAGSTGNGRGSRLEVALVTGRTRPRQSPLLEGEQDQYWKVLIAEGKRQWQHGAEMGLRRCVPKQPRAGMGRTGWTDTRPVADGTRLLRGQHGQNCFAAVGG